MVQDVKDMTTETEFESGPTSIDSDYDECLAISDVDIPSPLSPDLTLNCQLSSFSFNSVHKTHTKFSSPHRRVFLSGQEIQLNVISFERSVTTHLLNPNLYCIELKHGDFCWTVKKRYSQILHLHQQLRLFRASLNIPLPSKSHRERRSSFKHEANKNKNNPSRKMPLFPLKPEALVSYDQLEHRMRQLEEYLRSLLKIKIYRNHNELANFFEVSELSFIKELGDKGMEGLVYKRTRSTHPGSGWNFFGCLNCLFCVRCNFVCSDLCGTWRKRWLVVKDNFIAYVRPADGRIKAVLLFDSAFEVSSGIFPTNVLLLKNISRHLVLKCHTRRTAHEWQSYLKEKLRNEGGDFTHRNRYMSFCPVRPGSSASWLVDGRSYMGAVASALEQAKQEIFIADWWLSPEIQLRRPAQGEMYRLDRVLQRKAEEGVKVFVLLYKEVEVALGINSFYSKQRLIAECKAPENLKVLRHPDHAKAGILLWAHHEKLVVVDQTVAFLGGLDLSYGRWDDNDHRLTDLGSSYGDDRLSSFVYLTTDALTASALTLTQEKGNEQSKTDGTVPAVVTVMAQPSPENMKCNTPEMRRKGLCNGVIGSGRCMYLWNFSSEDESEEVEGTKIDKNTEKENLSLSTIETNLNGNDLTNDIEKKVSLNLDYSDKLWIGKDYTNFILKDFVNLDHPFQDLVDRTKTARMPWHDVGIVVHGAPARDLARHFIQRWNAVKLEKARLNPQYPYLLPKSYREFSDFFIPGLKQRRITCQVVRSLSHWSGGSLDPDYWEGSIHEAYIDVIDKAEHYIYMENQFFITGGLAVRNQVGNALINRIIRAHREGTRFRVYIVLPLLPGFEGEVGTSSGTALHAITHWNYASICRGKSSLLSRLAEAGIEDPSEYITFHGLRNHAELNDVPVTELIYVHSKLLIADDRIMICGSANINDRSLLGKRDSEIAVVISDEEFKAGTMGGEWASSGRLCGSLRRALFREHLGVQGPSVRDPVSPEFYHGLWRNTAKHNTEIYEEVFRCIPSDEVKRFEDLKSPSRVPLVATDLESARNLLKGVQGHLVMFPLEFLQEQSLTPTPSSVEGILPTSVWT